jgi:hypothetical protein
VNVLLLKLLAQPNLCKGFSASDWDAVIPQARNTGVLAALGKLLETQELIQDVPAEVRRHLDSVVCVHNKQVEGLTYEIKCLSQAMNDAGEKLILLKGAAYIVANLPPAAGRLISDFDLLVPEAQLAKVELTLQKHGWGSGGKDPYNELYYRKWMHEIPPIIHEERDSVLDVHHTILPPTADEKLDVSKLFEELQEVKPGIFVLSPVNMVLHSATHLFHEGQFTHGLRDLLDLDRLLQHFSTLDTLFWQQLINQAQTMRMANSLYYALRYTNMFLSTPIPAFVNESLEKNRNHFPRSAIMDFLFVRGFLPDHRSCALPFKGLAHYCLYIRSHYLRMPLYLLLPHLTRKAWMGRFSKPDLENEADEEDQRQK